MCGRTVSSNTRGRIDSFRRHATRVPLFPGIASASSRSLFADGIHRRLDPLLIHFPIALVIVAALAEVAAMVTAKRSWRAVSRDNVRAGAVFAILATIAGWRLAGARHGDFARSRMASLARDRRRWRDFAAALATSGVRRSAVKCGSSGLLCSPREPWWPLPGLSEECLFGARTFCASERGTGNTDR